MRAKRSSTAASSKATVNLQLQNAKLLKHKNAASGPHFATKKTCTSRPQQRTGVHIQRRSGFWQPDGWNSRTSAKKRASTSFIGGLEIEARHCPAAKCQDLALRPAAPPLLASTASWLRWDHNPVWAADMHVPGSAGQPSNYHRALMGHETSANETSCGTTGASATSTSHPEGYKTEQSGTDSSPDPLFTSADDATQPAVCEANSKPQASHAAAAAKHSSVSYKSSVERSIQSTSDSSMKCKAGLSPAITPLAEVSAHFAAV